MVDPRMHGLSLKAAVKEFLQAVIVQLWEENGHNTKLAFEDAKRLIDTESRVIRFELENAIVCRRRKP